MPNILDMLKADHKEAIGLLKQLTADEPPSDCDALFEKLYGAVTAHLAFEDQELYPLLMKGDAKDLAIEGSEEHHQIKTLLDALNEMDDDDETCTAKLNVLQEDLVHHVKEEETELHPQLKKEVSEEVLQRLGVKYQHIKDKDTGDARAVPHKTAKAASPSLRSGKGGRSR